MRCDPWDPTLCETHEYRNPDGETVRWLTLVGTTGRFMPPIQLTSIPVPLSHGSRFVAAAHLERAVVFPVAAPGIFDGRDELRRWARVFDPAKGEGTVTVVEGDYPGRRLRCVYEAGLDELEEVSASGQPGDAHLPGGLALLGGRRRIVGGNRPGRIVDHMVPVPPAHPRRFGCVRHVHHRQHGRRSRLACHHGSPDPVKT